MLDQLETQARDRGLLLRLQMGRPLGLWSLRLVVAQSTASSGVQLLGEMKGWAYAGRGGLQLDTMRVVPQAPAGVGHLIWAATMAWALETTPAAEPGCWRSAMTSANIGGWCVISACKGFSPSGRWQQPCGICHCDWCGAEPGC